jgi:hypothetical protein
MSGFRSHLLLRLLAAAWAGLAIGLVRGNWDEAAVATAIYVALFVIFTLIGWEPPDDAVAGHWEDLNRRQRRTVMRALWTGSEPGEQRLARITERARGGLRRRSGRGVVGTGLRAAIAVGLVVAAAIAGAPAGWVVAGALFPIAIAALALADRLGGRRALSS